MWRLAPVSRLLLPTRFPWGGTILNLSPLRPLPSYTLHSSPSPCPSISPHELAPDTTTATTTTTYDLESGENDLHRRRHHHHQQQHMLAEARKLMKPADVESLMRRLEMEVREVIWYTDLLKAGKEVGPVGSSKEAVNFVNVLDNAGDILAFADKFMDLQKDTVPLALAPENKPNRQEFRSLQKKKGAIHILTHRWKRQCCRSYSHMVDFRSPPSNEKQLIQVQEKDSSQLDPTMWAPSEGQKDSKILENSSSEEGNRSKKKVGDNISSRDKNKFLIDMLHDLDDSKEAVYGALDAWVAWERNFPISRLKNVLLALQTSGYWHRSIQVIKWMLSKGQGNTMGTNEQLIRALDKDNRAEEAHTIWIQKIGSDLHSVPWRLCELMISIYYRNNMLERLVKLFKDLEAFDRRPQCKSAVRKVSDACEMLGLLEEKDRILEKYNYLFVDTPEKLSKKRKKALNKLEPGKMDQRNSEVSNNGPVACGQ